MIEESYFTCEELNTLKKTLKIKETQQQCRLKLFHFKTLCLLEKNKKTELPEEEDEAWMSPCNLITLLTLVYI